MGRSFSGSFTLASAFFLALSVGCGSSSTPGTDASPPEDDAGQNIIDTGMTAPDAGGGNDAEPVADSGVTPDGGEPDTGPRDAGMALTPELTPGSHVQVAEARVDVMTDSFQVVRGKLGAGTRSAAANTRSYEWSLSGGVQLTIWFANTNLDNDDAPPNDVDDSDRVLWIAVQGDYTGLTPAGIGINSTRAQVETAYQAAPHTVPIDAPPGTLAQYFTTGMLVAYDPQNNVRTLTIHRAYLAAPDGEIDPTGARIRLSTGEIRGLRGIGQSGTRASEVMTRLGLPDAQGRISISGQSLDTMSYAFVGIELFFLEGQDRVLFLNVHPPYYGATDTGVELGATRTAMESFLTADGYDGGRASGTSANFICYEHQGGATDLGATYSTTAPPTVTSITIPLLQCP